MKTNNMKKKISRLLRFVICLLLFQISLYILFGVFVFIWGIVDKEDIDGILDKINSNQNVEQIIDYSRENEWKAIVRAKVLLKNGIVIDFNSLQFDKNGQLCFDDIFSIDEWRIREIGYFPNTNNYCYVSCESRKMFSNNYFELAVIEADKNLEMLLSYPLIKNAKSLIEKSIYESIPQKFETRNVTFGYDNEIIHTKIFRECWKKDSYNNGGEN